MKKKTVIVLLFVLFAALAEAQVINTIAEGLADNVHKKLRKDKLPVSNPNIYVLFFNGDKGSMRGMHTRLGMDITNRFVYYLKQNLQKTKSTENCKVMVNNAQGKALDATMKKSWSPPETTKEELEFYRQMQDKDRPHYFIAGKYEITGDFQSIKLKEVKISNNKFNQVPSFSYVFDEVKEDIEEAGREKLKQAHVPIHEIPEDYVEFVTFKGDAGFMDMQLLYANRHVVEPNKNLSMSSNYLIKINTKEEVYIYGFYYETGDLLQQYLYMLQPLTKNGNRLYEKGSHYFPKLKGKLRKFAPSAKGQVMLKFIATRKKLAIDFEKTALNNYYMKPEQCRQLNKQLKSIGQGQYQTISIVKNVE